MVDSIAIKIIDAPCGAGKTTWAIQQINHNSETSYVYCTPFLDEIDRIRNECGWNRFREPQQYTGSKIDNFNELLSSGGCVAVSHVTFLNATAETLQAIHEGSYTLILDEVLDVIMNFNDVQTVEDSPEQSVSKADIKMLMDKHMIEIGNSNKVKWCGGDYGEQFKFAEVRRYAEMGRLYCARETLLLAVFPPEMFTLFDNIYVLTYMFDGSMLKYYFDLFGIKYELASINEETGDLTKYFDQKDRQFRQQCKELIKICDIGNLNKPKRTLSKSWFDRSTPEMLNELKKDISSYFRSYVKDAKAAQDEIMWTCAKTYANKLQGKGYTYVRMITKNERTTLTKKEVERLKKTTVCFVPCNAKATNIYRNRWALAYCYNMFLNPYQKGFLEDNGIAVNEDMYALSCLIQWICRSRLRDGKNIVIYIPSKRMRTLLNDWLDGKGGVQTLPETRMNSGLF